MGRGERRQGGRAGIEKDTERCCGGSDLSAQPSVMHAHYPTNTRIIIFLRLTHFKLTRSSVSNLACAHAGTRQVLQDGPEEASGSEGAD